MNATQRHLFVSTMRFVSSKKTNPIIFIIPLSHPKGQHLRSLSEIAPLVACNTSRTARTADAGGEQDIITPHPHTLLRFHLTERSL